MYRGKVIELQTNRQTKISIGRSHERYIMTLQRMRSSVYEPSGEWINN